MNRKDFLLKTVPAVSIGLLATCKGQSVSTSSSSGSSLPSIEWKLASSFPRGLETIFGGAEDFSERVKTLTDGKFNIKIYPAGELVPGLQVFDSVQNGTVQIGHSAGYYYTGKHQALAFDTGVPFGLTARQQNAWMYQGGGLQLMNKLYAKFNIISFPGGNTGTQMGGWFRSEIKTLKDIKGIKIRIPGLGGQVMTKLGANVQVLAGGDIFPALERGAIDATEWVGPYDDEKLGFYKIIKNYYYPGWWEPSTQLSFYVNKAQWEKLPKLYQEILKTAMTEANMQMLAKYDSKNPDAIERLVQNGVKLQKFSDEIMNEAKKAAFQLMEENASKDPDYKEIYTAWLKFREKTFKWFGINELAYANFAFKGN